LQKKSCRKKQSMNSQLHQDLWYLLNFKKKRSYHPMWLCGCNCDHGESKFYFFFFFNLEEMTVFTINILKKQYFINFVRLLRSKCYFPKAIIPNILPYSSTNKCLTINFGHWILFSNLVSDGGSIDKLCRLDQGWRVTGRGFHQTMCCWCLQVQGCCGWGGQGSMVEHHMLQISQLQLRCWTQTFLLPPVSLYGQLWMSSSLENLLWLEPCRAWWLDLHASHQEQVSLNIPYIRWKGN